MIRYRIKETTTIFSALIILCPGKNKTGGTFNAARAKTTIDRLLAYFLAVLI